MALNQRFFLFLAARRGCCVAVAAMSFHVFYSFYHGVAFGAGVARFAWRNVQQGREATTADETSESMSV